jgi:glutamyl-tRNA synthetase
LAFRLRVEDLDQRCRPEIAQRQLADLRRLGLNWDGPVMYQSERQDAYRQAITHLRAEGLVYECFCSRRDIIEAPRAPHQPPGAYPGTCRCLTRTQREARRASKVPSLRLRSQVDGFAVVDRLVGVSRQPVDDFVLRRADGAFAYNLAVVVDDAAQAVTQVTRGDDLLTSAGRQSYLGSLLGLPPVEYLHLPLVLGAHGQRLSKRDKALAGKPLFDSYGGPAGVLQAIWQSLGLAESGLGAQVEAEITLDELVEQFDWERWSIGVWTV